jgi:sec-independent protein translocase protein TatA
MFGFSGEHLLVLLIILLLFGPKRLPDLGHSLGRTLKNFKDAMNGQGNSAEAPRPAAPAQQIPPQQTAQPAAQEPGSQQAAAAEPQKTEHS